MNTPPEGWQSLQALAARYPQLAVAVETSQGTVVEHLLGAGWRVFPINPKAAQRYRELAAQDPLVAELRLLCRDAIALIEQRTALINQLRQCLHEYYPAALQAFEDWTSAGAWAFF